ncbi:hypothetical protein K431DRAFT_252052 [Polychaeton citri CBS 116435]|uniref:mRNA decay factor PAT1 domain-containing protein n=1 Tax=Polychaeton citri CBS 116435 TaxID=1314669 RepID=A0A9P4Q6K1_9PEZI|nr:hypothetical protein K431DRAFT_252052 [Polychaeton citri CBS 116435]
MSFFGFDTALPEDKRSNTPRGMFERQDPFAGLGQSAAQDEGETLNFEDTYDGLGNRLVETGDTFNDDTFGGDEPVTREAVGRDFDFAGNTAQVMQEHGVQYSQPSGMLPPGVGYQQPRKKNVTGYERYREPDYIPRMEADASIWGKQVGRKGPQAPQAPQAEREDTLPIHPAAAAAAAAANRKMMSLEEVEAAMRTQSRPSPQPQADVDMQSQGLRNMLGLGGPALQQPQQHPQLAQRPQVPFELPTPNYRQQAPQILQRQHTPQQVQVQVQAPPGMPPMGAQFQQPLQPGMPGVPRAPAVQPPHGQQQIPTPASSHSRGPSYSGPPVTQAQQMMNMTTEDREAYLAEEARRAKRNHKIFLLSKNNGFMTPQDKNFITRIQLQQLLTATGGIDNDPGSEEQLDEDFYYQVYASIRGGAVAGRPSAGAQFAQTYLYQTGGSRYGYGRGRHHPRGGDNHVQRMEQQVARAVEAAKARPKNKQLVVEGSLGKIAFSNSKTPRPLLNIKRQEETHHAKARKATVADRKVALRDIEAMYSILMRMEDHERKLPPPPNEESPPEVIESHMRWRSEMQQLNQRLWDASKVMEPIDENPGTSHPFIQILSHSKGKKAIPRVFRHLDEQQRLTMLTLVAIHLDLLDVIRDAYPPADNAPLPQHIKEEIELFSLAVMPPLFSFVNEAPLNIIIGLVGLVVSRVNVQAIARTKIGLSILTMFISRAELVRQAFQNNPNAAQSQQEDWTQWHELYARLFDVLEPVLPYMFPTDTNIAASDDVHVWQFLAAMGVGATPDQQQRLVLGVKERVMETVSASQALPEGMKERRLGDVNLFMRAIGLDVELLA